MKVGIVVFPGSNCDQDCQDAVTTTMGAQAVMLWHADTDLRGVDALILPGGFSYGDYLRSGAIARLSPVMRSVVEFSKTGRPILGICNGFQILTEAGLLPGALIRNQHRRFICQRQTALIVENNQTPFTRLLSEHQLVEMPVAHGDGNYVVSSEQARQLFEQGQVVFRYAQAVNGSTEQIAGVTNPQGNILGMMPHPERNLWQTAALAYNGQGALIFESLKQFLLNASVQCA